MTPFGKAATVVRTIANWPQVGVAQFRDGSTVEYKTRNGMKFRCRTKSPDTKEVVAIASGLEYDPALLHVDDGAVVFDVGANIGAFAILLDHLNHGRTYRGFAFEPLPANVEMLERNLALNGVEQFEVVSAVIGPVDGTMTIDDALAFNAVKIANSGRTVDSHRLSTFASKHSIDRIAMLKMDIEGAEYDILEADIEFVRESVDALFLEFHRVDGDGRYSEWIESQLSPAFDVRLMHEVENNGVIYASRRK